MTVTVDVLNSFFDKTMQAWDAAQSNPSDTDLFLQANQCQTQWEGLLAKFKVENPQEADLVFVDSINRTVSIIEN